MSPLVALILWSSALVVVAGLTVRPAAARFGLVLMLLMLPLPALIVASPLVIVVFATAIAWSTVRATDLVLDHPPERFGLRFAHLVLVLDTRALTRGRPRFDPRALLRLAFAVALGAAGVALVFGIASTEAWWHLPLHWLGGALLAMGVLDASAALLEVGVAASGWNSPPLHDAPYLSRSISEFWGRRWNRIVSDVLRRRAFMVFGRRDPWRGLCAAFAFSAVLHAYLMLSALGPGAALAWAAFFLVQPLAIAAERRLRVRRWPVAAQRTWTLGVLGLLSPLMTDPGLRLFDL